ncbi:MAG TPA: hypothetical protein P5160_03355 [Candidatus Omnitrophota bacterium]|nr:hypothetical protein [Candidatus Omnitrophota bacterium]
MKKLICLIAMMCCCVTNANAQAKTKKNTKAASGQPHAQRGVQNYEAVWDGLSYDDKVKMVAGVIAMFKEERGVIMRKDPAFYVDEVEIARSKNPDLFSRPIGAILRVMFILNRDFGDGRDPDEAIRRELGEKNYRKYVSGRSAEENEKYYRQWLKDSVKRKAKSVKGK